METGAISHAEIEVRVTERNGTPLPGVIGLLDGGLVGERTEISTSNGGMVFSALPPGAYRLTFSLRGFASVKHELTIHETNEHDPIIIVLTPDETA